MGDVYRADDLELGESVALKFLPLEMTHDPIAVARLRNEVRVARQIAHPNVCRVYDFAQAEGHAFLSMEYVDGEDLASILRRMGRPSKEKAIQIARQLCAGLNAAHERGVLHRDLKPSNVMLDGRGRVRITDFGLAAAAQELQGPQAMAGTPRYMAPEQLAGKDCTVRSDIFSLGLVLYEIFHGRSAFRAHSIDELLKMYEVGVVAPSEGAPDEVDAEAEQVIRWCLQKDPNNRPPSALAVLATLPGGDPLTELLAAGETPPPEMVAAAGGSAGLRFGYAVGCLAAIVLGFVFIALLNNRVAIYRIAPPEKPPVVLADRAREILKQLRYPQPVDKHGALYLYRGYLLHIEQTDKTLGRWNRLRDRRPPVYNYWYRESPEPMVAMEVMGRVSRTDPPFPAPGRINVVLDGKGRLAILQSVPPVTDMPVTVPPSRRTDFSALFTVAELNPGDFKEVQPTWLPPGYADERIAWEGHYPEQPDWPVRVEAAAYRGRPVYFHLLEMFDRPEAASASWGKSPQARVLNVVAVVLGLGIFVAALWIARQNFRMGRGDRKSAFRVTVFLILAIMLEWVISADFVSDLGSDVMMFEKALGMALLAGVVVGCMYLALEPFARRLWPAALISWTRLMMGQLRDPMVGRDLLVGGVAGVLMILIQRMELLVSAWFGSPWRIPYSAANEALGGGRDALALLFDPSALTLPVVILLLLTGFRYLMRRQWPAVVGVFLVLFLFDSHWWGIEKLDAAGVCALAEVALCSAIALLVLLRFGLLALVVTYFFVFRLQQWPITLDMTVWYAGTSVLLMVVLGALTAYGLYLSGRQRAFLQTQVIRP